MHDYTAKKLLLIRQEPAKISSFKFHPDGLIMAVGYSNGKILIYDVRDMVVAQELDGMVEADVKQIEFSNKGIFLAAIWSGQDTCRVYSLHKGFAVSDIKLGSAAQSIAFDIFGNFLAIGTSCGAETPAKVCISSHKNWKKVLANVCTFESGETSS